MPSEESPAWAKSTVRARGRALASRCARAAHGCSRGIGGNGSWPATGAIGTAGAQRASGGCGRHRTVFCGEGQHWDGEREGQGEVGCARRHFGSFPFSRGVPSGSIRRPPRSRAPRVRPRTGRRSVRAARPTRAPHAISRCGRAAVRSLLCSSRRISGRAPRPCLAAARSCRRSVRERADARQAPRQPQHERSCSFPAAESRPCRSGPLAAAGGFQVQDVGAGGGAASARGRAGGDRDSRGP